MLLLFKLVKSGYGSYTEVNESGARFVLQALNFEKFCGDYESAWWELNK